jgi:MFS family permease
MVLGRASLGYMSGQVVVGSQSDRWGHWTIGIVAAALAGLGLVILGIWSPGTADLLLLALALCTVVGIGATLAVRNAVLADLFDWPSLGPAPINGLTRSAPRSSAGSASTSRVGGELRAGLRRQRHCRHRVARLSTTALVARERQRPLAAGVRFAGTERERG